MKKALIYWFSFLLWMYCSSVFLISCKSKVINKETIKDRSLYESSDISKTSNTDRSLAIYDKFNSAVPYFKTGSTDKNCDSLCNAKKEEWLRTLNQEKQSGNNGYQFYYDELTEQLKLNIEIGETVNMYHDSLAITKQLLRESESKTIEVPVKYIPKIVKILAGIGGCSLLFLVVWIVLKMK